MPIIEVRESLGNQDVLVAQPPTLPGAPDSVTVIQKRINLKEGTFQRNMLKMDLFFDDFPHAVKRNVKTPQPFDGVIEFYVTPTPLILTNQTVQLTKRAGPLASQSNVLFKALIEPSYRQPQSGLVTRFPNSFLATEANFPFYHDQLYLTMIFHPFQDLDEDVTVRFAATMYMSYNEKKVSAVRSAMGVISERFEMMIGQVNKFGRVLQRPLDLAGQTIPAYNWGGIRPEYMVSGSTLAQFFLRKDGQEAEPMQTSSSLRNFAKFARRMVSNPDAFGSQGPGTTGPIPDWFTEYLPKGVEAGAVRPQMPPRVTQDNPALPGLGNILMV